MASEADRCLPPGEGTEGEEKTEGEGVKMEAMSCMHYMMLDKNEGLRFTPYPLVFFVAVPAGFEPAFSP